MKKSPEQMKKELWTMGMIALALFFIALARGMSGDFDVKFTIGFFYSIRYNKTIKKNKE